MTVEKPKPKQLLRPITTGAGSAMNQSQFLAKDLFSLYVLFSHFRPRDALMEIFLLFFLLVMRAFARA